MIQIEKGDIIATKDGQTYRVLSVFMNGDSLTKIEGIDETERSPMRRPVFSNQIAKVLKKAVKVEAPVETREGK
jgi:hypothetical protein